MARDGIDELIYGLHLLSEAHFGEYLVSILERKGTYWYIDAQNWRHVPPKWVEAGWMP